MIEAPVKGVLFDFHRTLVVAGSLERWLDDASRATGEPTDGLLPALREVWARAARRHPDTAWDLDASAHRAAFVEVLTDAGAASALAEALYASMPMQWVAVPGAADLLRGLRARGVRTGLLSNTALELRPRLAELGLLGLLDVVLTSVQEGLVKPDPALFECACAALGVAPRECVYVGDSPAADGGAVAAGMTVVLVPVVDDLPRLHVASRLLLG